MEPSLTDRAIRDLVRAVKERLVPLADPKRAERMRVYMRAKFEFLGVPTPVRRSATVPLLRSFDPVNAAGLLKMAGHFWKMAERDYTFVALDLLDCHRSLLRVSDLPALFRFVRDRSWWDSVDSLAGIIGYLVRRDKRRGQMAMDSAIQSEHLWVRRVAMLHQLGWRGETDTERLFEYAERLSAEKDFFIRKAIGWALRDYAKHDRRAVEAFVEEAKDRLSPLSCREALLLRTKVEVKPVRKSTRKAYAR